MTITDPRMGPPCPRLKADYTLAALLRPNRDVLKWRIARGCAASLPRHYPSSICPGRKLIIKKK